ncbi:MAG: CobW family GTP-binding protein [Clostridia bacterium]|nr:CobW family GTP-binding protein [Clostridia bacterium]
MTKIDIFSGFLGAGKTTLIKKLIKEAYNGEKIVLIENEFGEIGIDGGFMKDAGVQVNEMNSGCICCSLVGDFGKALHKVLEQYAPDRILIEPSGVGKLSDVIRAVRGIEAKNAELNGFTTVVDANKCKMYMKNFGEFFNDQIEHASSIILSHTDSASDAKTEKCIELLREHNADAVIVATPWDEINGKDILAAMEKKNTLEAELKKLEEESSHDHHEHCCDHDHHDHDHHDHDHHDHDHHDHDHHDHDHHDHDHHDHDHHDHEHGECCCQDHDHHHHHADEVFTSWGKETTHKYSAEEMKNILGQLESFDIYGTVLRAKGIVENSDGGWIHFDYVPEESDVRSGSAAVIGRICVIGADIKEEKLAELFGV